MMTTKPERESAREGHGGKRKAQPQPSWEQRFGPILPAQLELPRVWPRVSDDLVVIDPLKLGIHRMTLAKFTMVGADGKPPMASDWFMRAVAPEKIAAAMAIGVLPMTGFRTRAPLTPGYDVRIRFRNVQLLRGDAVIGGYQDMLPWVLPAHRGKGLGADIMLTVFMTNRKKLVDTATTFSPGGLGVRRHLHRRMVAEALRNGLTVPEKVLADYPGIQSPSRPLQWELDL